MRFEIPDEFLEALAERLAVKVAPLLRGEGLSQEAPLEVHAAAERLGVSPDRVRFWLKSGKLSKIEGVHPPLIPAAEVAAMAAGRRAAG